MSLKDVRVRPPLWARARQRPSAFHFNVRDLPAVTLCITALPVLLAPRGAYDSLRGRTPSNSSRRPAASDYLSDRSTARERPVWCVCSIKTTARICPSWCAQWKENHAIECKKGPNRAQWKCFHAIECTKKDGITLAGKINGTPRKGSK